jgi:hypothetical protein
MQAVVWIAIWATMSSWFQVECGKYLYSVPGMLGIELVLALRRDGMQTKHSTTTSCIHVHSTQNTLRNDKGTITNEASAVSAAVTIVSILHAL